MAADWQDHFHLLEMAPASGETNGEYKALAPSMKPRAMPEPMVIAAPRRALDGTFRAHVLQSGGVPVRFVDWSILVKLDTWPEYEALTALLGKTLYYVPNYHDQAAHDGDVQLVFFDKVGQLEMQGPLVNGGIHIPIHLVDAG